MMKEQSMTSKSSDVSSQGSQQGDNVAAPTAQPGPPEHQTSKCRSPVFKSGPLYVSSKGIGWTSWKKRWFILTRTSLVFFRSDPSQTPQKGGEVNLTLGGIDLNNSASVEVKTDKKLLTVLFPDGREGRTFTLKAETLEDLQEWKTALENALALAPSPTNNAGQNGVVKSEQGDDSNDAADEQDGTPGPPGKSMVLGRPILLALEDADGTPSFLEKALRFIEDHGVNTEGVLRQAADVEDVYHRVHEYEQGKTEFSPDEDAHVIGDCIKYILRELPSSPVPASCCNALVEALRTDRNHRVNAMRNAILETFPEPNRRLLQRMLQMMQIVASKKTINRMSTSAVAACMSPLILRPLLAGECELGDTHMDVAGDGSFQLIQAAAAANHAQAIIITLLDQYEEIFGDGSISDSGLFSDSTSGSGTEEASDEDDDEEEEDEEDDNEEEEEEDDEDEDEDEDDDENLEDEDHGDESDEHEEHSGAESDSGSGGDHKEGDSNNDKHSERSSSFSKSPDGAHSTLTSQRSLSASPHSSKTASPRSQKSASPRSPKSQHVYNVDDVVKRNEESLVSKIDSNKLHSDKPTKTSTIKELGSSIPTPETGSQSYSTRASQFRRLRLGRTSARKNLSMESIDFQLDDEQEIERLEAAKHELESRIEEEASGNSKLQASLEKRKKALHERRLALEKDVTRLQEQLQRERDLRATLGAGSEISKMPEKVELQQIELAEEKFGNLKQRLDDIDNELHHQHDLTLALFKDRNIEVPDSLSHGTLSMYNKDIEMRDELHHRVPGKKEGQLSSKADGDDHDRKNQSKKNQNHPSDVPRGGSSRFRWFSGGSSSTEVSLPKPSFSTSRKSSMKGEERRTQIANELQSIDKGRGSSIQCDGQNQCILNPGKGKGSHPTHESQKNQGPGGSVSEKLGDQVHQPSNSSGKGSSTDVDNNRDNNQSSNKKGSSSKSEASSSQNEQHHDRLKSEGGQSSSKNSDKGRQQDAKTSRTQSK